LKKRAMIIEGLMTTTNGDGTANVSPMGPRVAAEEACDWTRLVVRPFRTSNTYANLKRTGRAVFHVTDDVEMIAAGAIGRLEEPPLHRTETGLFILEGACRWYALEVACLDDSQERTTIEMRVTERGTQREFFGLNRAKHAVVEAAILATRLHLIERAEIERQLAALKPLVEKTGGSAEHRAFDMLAGYIAASEIRPAAAPFGNEVRHG
jgi:hypothetical protein